MNREEGPERIETRRLWQGGPEAGAIGLGCMGMTCTYGTGRLKAPAELRKAVDGRSGGGGTQ